MWIRGRWLTPLRTCFTSTLPLEPLFLLKARAGLSLTCHAGFGGAGCRIHARMPTMECAMSPHFVPLEQIRQIVLDHLPVQRDDEARGSLQLDGVVDAGQLDRNARQATRVRVTQGVHAALAIRKDNIRQLRDPFVTVVMQPGGAGLVTPRIVDGHRAPTLEPLRGGVTTRTPGAGPRIRVGGARLNAQVETNAQQIGRALAAAE